MADESFMLLSLKEQQSKKLAQVIGSDSCRRILEYLTDREFTTETQTAKDLGMPLSTAHYNLKALLASGLVVAEEYHYSDKGKEVPHYKLAKKFIIIAPREETGVMERIKRMWPLAAVTVGVAAIIELAGRLFSSSGAATFAAELPQATPRVMEKAADTAAPALMAQGAPVAVEASRQFPSPFTMWFLGGALFVILVMVVWEFVRKR